MLSDDDRASETTRNLQLLWLVMAMHMPPKRLDFGCTRVVRAEHDARPGENTIVVSKAPGAVKLILAQYKTVGRYEKYTETLDNTVAAEVRSSLHALPRQYLFVTQDLEPMGDDYFGVWLERTFRKRLGKHATANALRRAWVRERADPTKYTIAEREELARQMNHSLITQFMHYGLVDR
jgi:hypothetical protein